MKLLFKWYRLFENIFLHIYVCIFKQLFKVLNMCKALHWWFFAHPDRRNSRRARSLNNRRHSRDCSESVHLVYSVCRGSSSRISVYIGSTSSCCTRSLSTTENTKVEEKFRKITGGHCLLLMSVNMWLSGLKSSR